MAARPCRFALLAALPYEVRPFLWRIKARRRRGLGLTAWELAVGRERGLVALTGMGGAGALEAAHLLLRNEPLALLVSVGFGGALTPELTPGALVLGTSFWEFKGGGALLTPGPAPPPPRGLPELLGRLREAGLAAFLGSLVTTPGIISKARLGEHLRGLARPVLDQESVVLARLAEAEGLAFLGLRAVTDSWREEIPPFIVRAGGNVGVGAALGWLAADPGRIRPLLHWWRRSRVAADRLARALILLLPLLLAPGQELQNQPAQEGQIDKDPHPSQGDLADEKGHGQIESQDPQVKGRAQQGLEGKGAPS
jgi:adenosylhomocysteine nucleosidase